MLRQELLKRKKALENYINAIGPWLAKAPAGTLWIRTQTCGNSSRVRYFLSDGRELSPRNEMPLIRTLAEKEYRKHLLKTAISELAAIRKLLSKTDDVASVYEQLSENRKKLVIPVEQSVQNKIRLFLEEPFPPSDFEIKYPNDTLKGDVVRSWQESLIADELYSANIPYRYERPFKLYNGRILRPDFTIMHPSSCRIFIWEHFGRTDKASYMSDTILKIKDYAKSGILLGKGLIATFDNDEFKLTRDEIKKIILEFFK